jgi:hypothetical protein
VVRFHLQLAASNISELERLPQAQFPSQKFHLTESIYHSASAILATYAQYIGGGHAGSIPYLRKVLLMVMQQVMTPYLLIARITDDLPSNVSIDSLREKLRRTEVALASCTRDRVEDIAHQARWFLDLAMMLAAKRLGSNDSRRID